MRIKSLKLEMCTARTNSKAHGGGGLDELDT